jgi:rhamnosyltransferase
MISIIIPTLNAEPTIGSLLQTIRQQTLSSEILLVDSSSSDETVKIAESFGAKIIIIPKKDFNHGSARNCCASDCEGKTLIFLTQDAIPADDYCLENLVRPLDDPQIVASFGRQLPRLDASPTEKFTRLFNYDDKPTIKGREELSNLGIKTFFFSNVCSAIKVNEFKELGCFPENIVMFEDLIFAAKAILKGYKIAYVPEAKVFHSHNFSLMQQFQRYLDAGISLRNNAWIFEHVKANKEGLTFLKQEMLYLSKKRQYHWIPYAIAESVFKFAGYWLGLHGIAPSRLIAGALSVAKND